MQSVMMGMLAFVTALAPGVESSRAQYEALVEEYDFVNKAAIDALFRARTDADRQKATRARPQPVDFAPRFLALAEKYRDDTAALDALTWVASHCVFGPLSEKALDLIAQDHSKSDRLAEYCGKIDQYGEPFKPYEAMLRAVLKSNPHRNVQGRACLGLAHYLKMDKEWSERMLLRLSLQTGGPVPKRLLSQSKELKGTDLGKLAEESANLFERVIKEYADVAMENSVYQTAGKRAETELFELRNLSVGKPAPNIEGEDIFGKPMKLEDYRGKVILLDFGSHRRCAPCRAMYPNLRKLVKRLEGEPFLLLGINIDDDRNEIRELEHKGEITWRAWWDGEGLEGPIATQWIIRGWPTLYIIDQKGMIRNKGFLSTDEINGTVDMLLKELASSSPRE